jgi:hypothetical protein
MGLAFMTKSFLIIMGALLMSSLGHAASCSVIKPSWKGANRVKSYCDIARDGYGELECSFYFSKAGRYKNTRLFSFNSIEEHRNTYEIKPSVFLLKEDIQGTFRHETVARLTTGVLTETSSGRIHKLIEARASECD